MGEDDAPAMQVFTTEGIQFVDGLTDRERSVNGHHLNAVRAVLHGDLGPLRRLKAELEATSKGASVGGVELTFDVYQIVRDAKRGAIDFDTVYAS